MNTANIKKYAPKARNNFIAAVTKQAARYGITAKGTEPMEQRGDIALIGEKAFPKAIAPARKALERMVEQVGFPQAMEQAAYSWFNRFCAIRYMEIHDFLDHGRRVLSTANGEAGTPQILDDCLDISLPGLDPQQVAELKLDGNKDEELYRELLLAQCHALHEAMPFLFEAVDDATELLLPDNLTKTDSLIRELVSAIPEDDWQDVEIIGWLYQFYISEKKDQVIGKVVKSEDIPAATQLFTPNWIVQYLVQNSVGRQWLQTYPDSPLRNQMPYFIEPGEQPPEVQAQLAETVPDAIDPESIKVLDPACGSGHILVEAYKILKAIYEERGYRSRDIPQQILKHNLFGLDIDDRAGQLAGFALMMLAREDDRRLFERVAEGEVTLNVFSLKETGHLNLPRLWQDLNLSGDWQQGSSQSLFETEQADLSSANADDRYQLLQRTLERFVEAKTFGSLIEVPEEDDALLKAALEELEQLARTGDIMQKPAAEILLPYVRQAWVLAQRYDSVIANPPYIGRKYHNPKLISFLKKQYKGYEKDLFSSFVARGVDLAKCSGHLGFMTPQVWMFLSSHESLRKRLISNWTLTTLVHPEYNAFWDSAHVAICAYTLTKNNLPGYVSSFIRLADFYGAELQPIKTLEAIRKPNCGWFYEVQPDRFKQIPGSPIAFWLADKVSEVFERGCPLSSLYTTRKGMATGLNAEFVRSWHEVDIGKIGFVESRQGARESGKKWFPYVNGGLYRKWYGNYEDIVNWEDDGYRLQNEMHESGRLRAVNLNLDFVFREGLSWSSITSDAFSIRYLPRGFLFSSASNAMFSRGDEGVDYCLGLLNSKVHSLLSKALNPTVNANPGDIGKIPLIFAKEDVSECVREIVDISKRDWDSYERSWNFKTNPLVELSKSGLATYETIEKSYWNFIDNNRRSVSRAKEVEEWINEAVINAYGLGEQIDSELSIHEVTLTSNPVYRYGVRFSEAELLERLQQNTIAELVSYSVGCFLGRFSINKPGLIIANEGGTLNDYFHQVPLPSFLPDEDGIIPFTDQEWFSDDATNRFREFVRVVWGDEHLQENLDFVAESLCLYAIKPKRGESALDTIRRYLSTQFYKDHLRTYKKRPIYWLFSSGKHKAFECLVYLHRYNEGTLARMRTEYVIPLSAKLNAYAEKLEQDKDASTSAAETKRLEKEIATLHKRKRSFRDVLPPH